MFCTRYKVSLCPSPLQSAAGTTQCCCDTTHKLCLTIPSLVHFPASLPLAQPDTTSALSCALPAFSHWVPGASQLEATHAPAPSAPGGEPPALSHLTQLCLCSVYICGEGSCVKQPVADQGSLGHLGTSRNCIVSAPAAQAACREGGKESCKVVTVTQNCNKSPISSFHRRIAHRERTVPISLSYISVKQKDSYPIIKEILEAFRPLCCDCCLLLV